MLAVSVQDVNVVLQPCLAGFPQIKPILGVCVVLDDELEAVRSRRIKDRHSPEVVISH